MDRFLERMIDKLTSDLDRRFSLDWIGRRPYDPLAVKLRDMQNEDLDEEAREKLLDALYRCLDRMVGLTEALESERVEDESDPDVH